MPNTETGWLYLPPIMPDKDESPLNWTSNLPATQWTYAGRRDFPLYVPPAGSQRNIQESSTIWIPAEKGTPVPAYPLQRDNGHHPHCQPKRFCQTAGNHVRPTSRCEPLATRTNPKEQDRKTYVLQIPTQEGMYYDPKKTVAYNKHWVID